jgi:Alpha/beta hydrolase
VTSGLLNHHTGAIGSVTIAAIAVAARQLGLADPTRLADELLGVDVDGLQEWFAQSARVRQRLRQGAGRLDDAVPMLTAGWSSTEPRLAVMRLREAGFACCDIIARQVDAADLAGSVLRQSRALADAELARAEAGVLGLGWPPGEDLILWAVGEGQLPSVARTVAELSSRLEELRTRNTDALHALAVALHADPRDPVENVVRTRVASAASSSAISTAFPAAISAAAAGPPSSTGLPTVATADGGIDQDNLRRLASDLQSTDVATLAMALGVRAALEKARREGGFAQLLVYESANSGSQGRAAISVGDLTTADNVAILAPGVGNSPVNMADGISSVAALRNEAHRRAPGDATAVVAWFGYDMPLSAFGGAPVNLQTAIGNTAAILDDGNARAGGEQLVRDLTQFREWAPALARISIAGFSMGSTTVSAAAAQGAKSDNVILLASPGASNDAACADDYPGVPDGHTFVTKFEQDPVTNGLMDVLAGAVGSIGSLATFPSSSFPGRPGFPWVPGLPGIPTPFGPDPANPEFGAQVIDVESNNPDIAVSVPGVGGPLGDFISSEIVNQVADLGSHHQESNYLGGESLQAVADVIVGHYSDVPIKPDR